MGQITQYMGKSNIAILMATYNGECYLKEQIESLLAQTEKEWTLFIHDDGSTDSTKKIIQNYTEKYDFIKELDLPEGLGAKENFFALLQAVDADYYFFCDQDDVWLKDKISISMQRMKQLELNNKAKETPLLVYTDLYVTDQNLKITHESFFKKNKIHPELIHTFDDCATTSFVVGCTMLINKLAKQCIVFPATHADMHDSWISLCTLKSGGIVSFIDQPLIYYRQHGNNTLGDPISRRNNFLYKIRNISATWHKNKKRYEMLKSLGYGSWRKYLKNKIKYQIKKLKK